MTNQILIHKTKPLAFHGWDWKEIPSNIEMMEIVIKLKDKFNTDIKIFHFDTQQDHYAMIVGPIELTTKEIADTYLDAYEFLYDNTNNNWNQKQ